MTFSAIIFDLDDTLYPEHQYRESGFRHISRLVSDADFVHRLIAEFENSGQLPLTGLVTYLVEAYRSHSPEITCYEDTVSVLTSLQGKYRLGLLTNNATGAQPQKLAALKIAGFFDAIVMANPPFLKPAVEPYLEALAALQVRPEEAIYVGDDMGSDFVGANQLGILTVQIQRPGRLKIHGGPWEERFHPKRVIRALAELESLLESISVN